jgi:hypothetical protein
MQSTVLPIEQQCSVENIYFDEQHTRQLLPARKGKKGEDILAQITRSLSPSFWRQLFAWSISRLFTTLGVASLNMQ